MKDVSVVIPSNRDQIFTLNYVPEWCDDIQIRQESGLNFARNAGVKDSKYEWVVILDDDLEFTEEWFSDLVHQIEHDVVLGAEGRSLFDSLDWPSGFTSCLGRVMAFHKDAWRDSGGFPDKRSHGGDTDFFMSAYEEGYEIVGIDHNWDHHDLGDEYSFSEHLEWLLFLAGKHPRLVVPRFPELFGRKFL